MWNSWTVVLMVMGWGMSVNGMKMQMVEELPLLTTLFTHPSFSGTSIPIHAIHSVCFNFPLSSSPKISSLTLSPLTQKCYFFRSPNCWEGERVGEAGDAKDGIRTGAGWVRVGGNGRREVKDFGGGGLEEGVGSLECWGWEG